MTGYFSCNNINNGAPKLNHVSNTVSPVNSSRGEQNSILLRYLRSGLPSDYDQYSSPKLSRPIVDHHHHSSRRGSSRSPLSSVENLEMSPLPATVQVEDDVLVMDGIFVGSSARNGSGKHRLVANSDSGGSSSTSSSSNSSRSSGYQMELCLSWENSGNCGYGSKCQFAHGQEELRPINSRPNNRNALESVIKQPYFSPQSSNNSPISPFTVKNVRIAPSLKEQATSKLYKALQSPSHSMVSVVADPEAPSTDWSPLDDAIHATLPSSPGKPPSREAVDLYIHNVLYGPSQRKRLPVFVDICSECNRLAHLSLQSKV